MISVLSFPVLLSKTRSINSNHLRRYAIRQTDGQQENIKKVEGGYLIIQRQHPWTSLIVINVSNTIKLNEESLDGNRLKHFLGNINVSKLRKFQTIKDFLKQKEALC